MPDILYPTGAGLNRDENILIEFDGILFPSCLKIFYGLQDCPLLETHPFKIYNQLYNKNLTSKELYFELSFYRNDSLLTYLNAGEILSEDDMKFIYDYTTTNWNYKEAIQLDINIAIRQLLSAKYIKNITIVFNNIPDDKDIFFIQDTLNPKDDENISNKIHLLIPDENFTSISNMMLSEMKSNTSENTGYTTIITNEIDFIKRALQEYQTYNCESSFFLLRNHDKNTSMYIDDNDNTKYKFVEDGTSEIIDLINPKNDRLIDDLPLPLSAKFARFAPKPFIHTKNTMED